ncbi:type I polyketide synthase [Streptomyces lydicus]
MTKVRDKSVHNSVAIVGMSGRFPGASDLAEFWSNLRDGVESIVPLSDEELLAAGIPPEVFTQPDYVRAAPRFEGTGLFDAEFFGYTPAEARLMDPQHRLFLETSWQALEDAGYDAARYPGTIGVFAGSGANRYLPLIEQDPRLLETQGLTQLLVANELGFLATRVSYKMNLTGPSISLRTACSTALVAVHTACRSLVDGDCDMALSGAVSVNLTHHAGYVAREGSFLSPDGHVRPFDAEARGTVFGNGVGVVVLKRLEDALADHDTIHAVIKGSAINNDGSVKVGFTAPSVTGQTQVIAAALEDAGVSAADIDYVEAHGTGTAMGDPIEVQALSRVFEGVSSCRLGSVKGNIGHLDAAAGIAGLLKTVLALKHHIIPPTLNHHQPNPDISSDTPFTILNQPTHWTPTPDRPRRAGISAFGFGGTNAHLIIEEPPTTPPTPHHTRTTHLLTLSARTPQALDHATNRLATHLRQHNPDLTHTSYTLAHGRHTFPHRRIVTGTTTHDIATALETRDPRHTTTHHTTTPPSDLIFVYSGQGPQHPHMGHHLYTHEPAYKKAVDTCADLLHPHLGLDIRTLLHPTDTTSTTHARNLLQQTQWAQPALFTTEYALTQLWKHWDITPTALIGHSLGELVAAHTAGILTLPDALHLTALRAQLMQQQPPGTMLNINTDPATIQETLPPQLTIAAHNTPNNTVISGPTEHIEKYQQHAHQKGWKTTTVNHRHAFHSPLMQPAIQPLQQALQNTPLNAPHTPIITNTTGTWTTPEQAQNPHHWAHQIQTTVHYATGIQTITKPGATLLEIGPGNTFTNLARHTLTHHRTPHQTLPSLPHPQDPHPNPHTTHHTLGKLWLHGTTPNWTNYHQNQPHQRIPLPTHPFNHQHHWLTHPTPHTPPSGLKRRKDPADWFHVPSWQRVALSGDPMPAPGRRWLLFTDQVGLGSAVTNRLRAAGARVTVAQAGASWSAPHSGLWTIDASASADYHRLVTESVEALGGPPTDIVHCWSVTSAAEDASHDEETARRLGFESLILLSQALSRSGDPTPLRLWVLSNGLHHVTGAESLTPVKSTVLGPCKVLSREMPGLSCRAIDLDYAEAPNSDQLDRLIAELGSDHESGTELIAHRGPHRWSQHYLPQRLRDPRRSGVSVRRNGAYLVTGGTGGLGLILVEHLVAAGARVVLTSRTLLPPPEEWETWTAEHPNSPLAETMRRLLAMRQMGTELLVLQADVGDRAAMRAAIESVPPGWGSLRGVFHTAGVSGGGLAQVKSLDTAATVLHPKVRGTLVLEEVLADRDLDFLVLYGSNTANVGSVGQVDYCAANCFMDAFAQDRGRHQRVVAVDWGPWLSLGMAADVVPTRGLKRADRQASGRAMTGEEGLWALDAILRSSGLPQVIVSPVDLTQLLRDEFSLTDEAPAFGADAIDQPSQPLHSPALVPQQPPATGQAPPDGLASEICRIWGEVLGIEQVDAHDSFFDLGGNSIAAIQMIGLVNEKLSVKLSLADLYEALTVTGLINVVEKSHRQVVGIDAAAAVQRREQLLNRRRQQRRRQADREK